MESFVVGIVHVEAVPSPLPGGGGAKLWLQNGAEQQVAQFHFLPQLFLPL